MDKENTSAQPPFERITPPSAGTMACKRAFDIVCSFLGLAILSPILLTVSGLVGVTSPGGVFFRQVRIGKDGKPFRIFKFRSMRLGSDKASQITIGERDSRITRSGIIIRKYKLDELPQLINVFIGDMSFVGPRPEVPKYVDLYTEAQRHVLDVRPGITDMASIKYINENELLGKANNPEDYYIHTIMPDKLSINLEYVKNNSFMDDVTIIFKTLSKIF